MAARRLGLEGGINVSMTPAVVVTDNMYLRCVMVPSMQMCPYPWHLLICQQEATC